MFSPLTDRANTRSRTSRPMALWRTSEVSRSVTARTNRRRVWTSNVAGCALMRIPGRAPRGPGSEPTPSKAGAAQAGQHRRAPPHDVPEQAGAVVLDHQRHRPLIDPEVIGSDPPAGRAAIHRERLIERGLEPILRRHPQV